MNYLVVSNRPWTKKDFLALKKRDRKNNWFFISEKKNFTVKKLQAIKPRFIFIPQWSSIIPPEIWANYECVVFHMTDLPYGRGGTPLQNLITRGHTKTKISALRVNAGLDTGDIYMKHALSLDGSADTIYKRMSDIIFGTMIPRMISHQPQPQPQRGRAVIFKRRQAEDSLIPHNLSGRKLYDFIRMLDAPGYPKAFIDYGAVRFEFSRAEFKKNNVSAHVKIIKK